MMLSQDPQESHVMLREISQDTVRAICDLKVSKNQEPFVAPNSVSIAEAHFSSEAWFRAIYLDNIPVGFVMLAKVPKNRLDKIVKQSITSRSGYFLWRLMIDQRYQGKGYGKKAIELVIKHIRERSNVDALYTSCREGRGSPQGFYKRVGFEETGEKLGNGELIMKLEITTN